MNRFKELAVLVLLFNGIYFFWLVFVVDTKLSIIFFLAEFGVFLSSLLFIFNNWKRVYQLKGGLYSLREIVDIFITTKNEDASLLKKTIVSAQKILHPNKRIYVLDDGDRVAIKRLADSLGVMYMSRWNAKYASYKAANLNFGLRNSFGNYILTLDADSVADERILDDLLGFFKDPHVALVSTRQGYVLDKTHFNNDRIFYEYAQAGKNSVGTAISTGAGVIYRRSALEKIGGFQEWSIVEDLYTTYVLNQHGFNSVYVSQRYIYGDAPRNVRTIYKQRGTWAHDTLRIMIWKSPLLVPGLSWRQRLTYIEMGYPYIVSGILYPFLYSLSIYSLFYNDAILTRSPEWYMFFRVPAFTASIMLSNYTAESLSSIRMWSSLFPIYCTAFIRALFYKKPVYHVTQKGTKAQKDIVLIAPQLILTLLGITGLVYNLINYGLSALFFVNMFWVAVMIFYFIPILKLGLFRQRRLVVL